MIFGSVNPTTVVGRRFIAAAVCGILSGPKNTGTAISVGTIGVAVVWAGGALGIQEIIYIQAYCPNVLAAAARGLPTILKQISRIFVQVGCAEFV